MEAKEWLASMPAYFPAVFYQTPLNHNPLIGNNQIHTVGNVYDVLCFVLQAIARSRENELQLSESETNGIYQVIETCGDALHFEIVCRPDGGEPDEDRDESDTGSES